MFEASLDEDFVFQTSSVLKNILISCFYVLLRCSLWKTFNHRLHEGTVALRW